MEVWRFEGWLIVASLLLSAFLCIDNNLIKASLDLSVQSQLGLLFMLEVLSLFFVQEQYQQDPGSVAGTHDSTLRATKLPPPKVPISIPYICQLDRFARMPLKNMPVILVALLPLPS